jgi:hypothetical protein
VGKIMRYRKRVRDAFDAERHAIIARNRCLVPAILIETRYRDLHRVEFVR